MVARAFGKINMLKQEDLQLEIEGREQPFTVAEIFGNDNPLEIEIGVGKGRFLRETAKRHPERNFIAVERARKYARTALLRAARDDQSNLRVFMGDGPELLELLPDESLSVLYILYSDPWPKKRHNKRRVIQTKTMKLFAKKIMQGGRLVVKTDFSELFDWSVEHIKANGNFEIQECGETDPERFDVELRTNYEVKTVKRGEKVFYLEALRK